MARRPSRPAPGCSQSPRTCVDAGFRTAQRRPREELVEDADFPLTGDLPHEQSRAFAEALAALPSEQRRVFVLREIVGLSYVEIAEEVDSTVASIQMLLFRARRSLRDQLDPPTVLRRPIFLPPLPGWLVGLWSRIEVATLTPRAAGALGATVLTVAGASVAVPVPQAVVPSGAAVAEPAAAPAVAKPKVGAPRKSRVRVGGVGPTTTRPARHSRPASTPAPAAVPDPAPPKPDVVATAATPHAVPALESTGVAATVVDDVLEVPSELPLPPVALPPLLPVPLPPVPDVIEAATGAAGAAGASAPPLPVPAVPLPTLPHAP